MLPLLVIGFAVILTSEGVSIHAASSSDDMIMVDSPASQHQRRDTKGSRLFVRGTTRSTRMSRGEPFEDGQRYLHPKSSSKKSGSSSKKGDPPTLKQAEKGIKKAIKESEKAAKKGLKDDTCLTGDADAVKAWCDSNGYNCCTLLDSSCSWDGDDVTIWEGSCQGANACCVGLVPGTIILHESC
jgi:hypothetical protein